LDSSIDKYKDKIGWNEIRHVVRQVGFGEVRLKVQDGYITRIVQIEKGWTLNDFVKDEHGNII